MVIICECEPGGFLTDLTHGRSLPRGRPVPTDGSRVITGVLAGQPAARKRFPGVPGALLLRGRSVFRDGANACIHESVAAQL